jgi:hypothetical protein
MSTLNRPALPDLEGYHFPVLFSEGARGRAKRVAERCHRANDYLNGVLEFAPRFRLLVLSPEDWQDHAAFPVYGMPHYGGAGDIFVGAAAADFFQGIVGLLDGVLNDEARTEMANVYGTADGELDVSEFADLLVVHELAHLYHVQFPFEFPRLWLKELFANLCLHAYVAKVEPAQLPVLSTWPAYMKVLPATRVRHHTLGDFERLYVGVGPENYGWYQLRLHAAARDIYDSEGTDVLRRMYATFAAQGGEMTDRQVLEILEASVSPSASRLARTWPT